jgi:YD repeat-containing protein
VSAGASLVLVQPPRNPWKGLHFYNEADWAIFFGRERETDEFLRLVRRDTLSVLFARSGLGKTSLLRAGVIPRLREEGFFPVIVRVDYAASAPSPARQIVNGTLAAADQAGIDVDSEDETAPESFASASSITLWEFFHRYQFWGPRNDPVVPVLILDQFEEAFTLGRESPRSAEFLAQLADLAENRMPPSVQQRIEETGEWPAFDTQAQNYKICLSLREDFVSKLDSLRPIMPAVMRSRFALTPLDQERSIKIVRQAGGWRVSDSVAREIVAVVGGEGAPQGSPAEIKPAYLSVMCYELFQRMIALGRDKLDSNLVAAEHGNILDAFYERSFEGLAPRARVFVEDHLLTDSGFRCSLPLAEAEREGVPLTDLKSLVDRRLLRFEDRLGTVHVELSHDLLTAIVEKSRARRRVEAERERERQREVELQAKLRQAHRRTLAWARLAMILLGGIVFSAYGWWIPYAAYCQNFTKRWGVPHAVDLLPKAAVAHRSWTIKLTQKGRFGPVQSLEVIDADYQLTGQHSIGTYLNPYPESSPREKEARHEFAYDQEGQVVYEVASDRFGRMVWGWGFAYSPDVEPTQGQPQSFAVGYGQLKSRKATFLGADDYPQSQSHSRAEFVEFFYDKRKRGLEAKLRYTDREGKPAPGPDNAYGQKMKYDGAGRLIRLTSLNEDGEPMNDKVGNAGQELKYGPEGNLIEVRAFDAQGAPTLLKEGFYRITFTYDEWGRLTGKRFFDLSGGPATPYGVHWIAWDYDKRGNLTSTKLYGIVNMRIKAAVSFFNFPAHEQRLTYNPQNRIKTATYFDQDGRRMNGPESCCCLSREYDDKGFVSAESFFDAQDKRINLKTLGYHRWEAVNDEFGQPIEERFFDTQRNPVATRDGGYHLRKNRYDEVGNLIEQSYFDVEDRPVADRITGAHRYVKHFDRFRNPVWIRYFDEAGQPINNQNGFHKEASQYNNYGDKTETRWYDKDGQPVNGPEGVHRVSNEYDERGLPKHVVYYNIENRPTEDVQGIHEILQEWNDKQQTKWQAFRNRARGHRRWLDHTLADCWLLRLWRVLAAGCTNRW